MKIQDIFKLNLNDRGGVKLFNKIMGRYNIPKADSKELINEVQNSSSGDGGIKEYYYRIANETPQEIKEMFKAFLNLVIVTSILNYDTIDGSEYCYKLTNGVNRDGSGAPPSYYYSTIRAFSCLDSDTHYISWGMDKPIILTGNLFDRISQFEGGGEVEAEMFQQMLEPYIQEITKEEYESMITYKP